MEEFENNTRPEWDKAANWAKIDSKINEPVTFRKTTWLILLMGLSIFGSGYALSYYIYQGKRIPAAPMETKIQPDTIQVIAKVTDTIVQYKMEVVYQRDTVFIEKEIIKVLAFETPQLVVNDVNSELPSLYIPVPESQFKKPDFKLPRTGKRTSKPYATNVFFDDTTQVTRTEFRIFHRMNGEYSGYKMGGSFVLNNR